MDRSKGLHSRGGGLKVVEKKRKTILWGKKEFKKRGKTGGFLGQKKKKKQTKAPNVSERVGKKGSFN